MPYNSAYQQSHQMPQAEEAMDWDGMINGDDAKGFEVLPEGDYFFTVAQFTRGRYEGGEKIGPCPKAVLALDVQSTTDPALKGRVNVNLFVSKNQIVYWKLCQFFVSIGYLKPGEEKPMNWSIVPGSSGTCAVTLREWTGNDGKKHTGNDVSRFYDPEKSPVPPAPPAASEAAQYAVFPSRTYQPPAAAGNQNAQQQMYPPQPATPWSSGKF